MRKLTIKRAKKGVACLAKTKFYIVAPYGDTTINGEPCAFLCDLKNGEEKTFEISSEQIKVYAICDMMSKDYCNDYYILDAGEEDVVLTGAHAFSPMTGNPFRFDNNNSAGVAENRKKGGKKGLIVGIIAAVVGFIIGFVAVGLLL